MAHERDAQPTLQDALAKIMSVADSKAPAYESLADAQYRDPNSFFETSRVLGDQLFANVSLDQLRELTEALDNNSTLKENQSAQRFVSYLDGRLDQFTTIKGKLKL